MVELKRAAKRIRACRIRKPGRKSEQYTLGLDFLRRRVEHLGVLIGFLSGTAEWLSSKSTHGNYILGVGSHSHKLSSRPNEIKAVPF